ncbi:MAG: phage tail tube protein [Pseudomonadota bacterium]
MPTASGLFKQVIYKKEVTYGLVPSAASAQLIRRVESSIDLMKETYQSNEIRPDFQIADFRHGVRRVDGSINGELSPKTYSDFFAASLKRIFTTGVSAVGASVTIAGAGPTYTVTRAAGSYLTDGFKVYDTIRLTVGTLNALNINKNLLIVGLTATVATVIVVNGSALAAEGPIATTTIGVVGKKTYTPTTGHTDESFSIEHFYADLTQSEVFSGCKPSTIAVELPPTGLATCNVSFMGKDIVTAAAQYFTSPTALTTTTVLAAVNGVVRVNGATVANLTGLSINIDSPQTGEPVVGSNSVPAMYPGRVNVTGQFTAYFDSVTLRDVFVNETEIDLAGVFTENNTASAGFVSFAMPRIKVGSASKSDGETGLIQTFSFQALLNTAGGTGTTTEATTLVIQDSAA